MWRNIKGQVLVWSLVDRWPNMNQERVSIKREYEEHKTVDRHIFNCPGCDLVFQSIPDLNIHITSHHEGGRYTCNQYEDQNKNQSILKKRQHSKHEGLIYSCNRCDFHAASKSHLKFRKQSKHKGIRYTCNDMSVIIRQQHSRALGCTNSNNLNKEA